MTPRRPASRPSQRRAAARLQGRVGVSWNAPLTLRVVLVLAAAAGACWGVFQLWAGRVIGGAVAPAPPDMAVNLPLPPRLVDGEAEKKRARRREEERKKKKRPARGKTPPEQDPELELDPDHHAQAPEEVGAPFHRFINCPGGGRDDPRLCPSARERENP